MGEWGLNILTKLTCTINMRQVMISCLFAVLTRPVLVKLCCDAVRGSL